MKKVFLLFCLMIFTGSLVNAQTVNVTFQVDMRVQMALGTFNPSTDVVTVPGGMNNWLNEPPANSEKVATDPDNDSVYTYTVAVAPNATYGYKFNIGLGWDGKDEKFGDRSVAVGSTDTTLAPSFFNDVVKAAYTEGGPASVTFSVDMQLPAQGNFDPSSHKVFVAGNFTDWGTGAVEMTDDNNDSIYTVTVDNIPAGYLAIYKFIHSPTTAGSGTWETINEGDDYFGNDKNRIIGIHDGENTIARNWQNTDPNVTTGNGNIFFEVDMSVLTELGVFNPDADSVQIRGSFNGWNDSQPARSLMNQDPGDPNHWFLDVPFVNEQLNGEILYKYYIKSGSGSTPYANTGWEVSLDPSTNGDRNHQIRFQGIENQEVGMAYFDGIRPEWVIPSGTSVDVTFSVDMTYATSADSQGTSPVFNPATDTVYWLPRLPLFYAAHGLPWPGEYPRTWVLTDPDQDMTYTGTFTFEGPDFNGFMYNYGFSSAGSLIMEAGNQALLRVRFIAQNGSRDFVNPYDMPLDVWSNTEKPEEELPTVSVKELPGMPTAYALRQNYPNPFNPATKIEFTLPETGLVSLKIYNALGEEVVTLINTEMKTGNYVVDFNAAGLSSGIYFYKITANNFNATKKMILMK